MKIIIMALVLFSSLVFSQTQIYEVHRLHEMTINSSINPATYNYLKRSFEKIKKTDLALIKMNTPGGLVSTTKDILTMIGEVDFPVVVWITPEGASATSAGAIISSGAHLIYMSEGTNIGAATPVGMGKDIEEKDGKAKAMNDLSALVISLAKARGKNEQAFSKMISEAASYDAVKANNEKIIDGIVSTKTELLRKLEGAKIRIKGKDFLIKIEHPEFVATEMDLGMRTLNFFADPMLAYILFILGAALLYFEFQAPGGFIMGAIGVISLILAGIGFQVLPLNIGALALIVAAFILFVMEIYITSYGALSLGGIAALVTGSLFLFHTDDSMVSLSHTIIYSTVGTVLLIMGYITYIIVRDSRKKQVDFFIPLGQKGTVLNFLKKEEQYFIYQIKVAGEIWNALSEVELQKDDQVEVTAKDLNHLRLKVIKT